MHLFNWSKRKADRQLSEYLDGELREEESAEIGERLVFDDDFMNRHDELTRVTELANAAISPSLTPPTEAFADRLATLLAAQSRASTAGPSTAGAVSATTTRAIPPGIRRHLKPATLASVGLLVTAGLTFAGLRRRGLV